MSELMTFEVGKEQDGGLRLTVSGECDLSNADLLRSELEPLIGMQPTLLTIDLGAMTYLDSSGLAVLAEAARRLGERLRVVAPEPLAQVFRVTRLDGAVGLTTTPATGTTARPGAASEDGGRVQQTDDVHRL